jgi:hypothetical protein
MSHNIEEFDRINQVRYRTGMGLRDIHEGMRLWPTDDPWLAAYYMTAKGHAINVKGDRDARDRKWAEERRKNDA